MSDPFVDAVSRQLHAMLTQTQGTINATQRSLGAPASADIQLSPQQVLEVMQGNSEWLQQFEQNIEKSFAQTGERITRQWLSATDSELRRSIAELSSLLGGENAGFPQTTGSSLSRLTGGLLRNLLNRRSSSDSHSETARSQEASVTFRDSRGQVQADLSRELSQGKRYL